MTYANNNNFNNNDIIIIITIIIIGQYNRVNKYSIIYEMFIFLQYNLIKYIVNFV